MPDLLVKLYALPERPSTDDSDVEIRRALAYDRQPVLRWVSETFGPGWEGECAVAFSRQPISCFIAVRQDRIVGFACHEATCRGFFGPTGVDASCRGLGIGTRLLFACLEDMKAQGHAYAFVGGAGPVDFYIRTAGATVVEGSTPGIYRTPLKNFAQEG